MRVDQRVVPRPGARPLLDVRIDLEGRDYSDMAKVTEDGLRKILDQTGWRTHPMPGHNWNTGGPDLVAYRHHPTTGHFILRVLDNKATHWANRRPERNITRASGLSARSLSKNLFGLVKRLRDSKDPLDAQAVNALNTVRRAAIVAQQNALRVARANAAKAGKTLTQAQIKAIRAGARVDLPAGPAIRVGVTNAGGRHAGVGGQAAARGVQWLPWWRLEDEFL